MSQFISYAQNYEDVILWRALKDIKKGFYIDVGAADPTEFSITKSFYDKGWTGINIEPTLFYFKKIFQERKKDINLNIAVGNKFKVVEFNEVKETGLSTINTRFANNHIKSGFTVKTQSQTISSLDIVIQAYAKYIEDIHFLKIDVEGAEKEVLEGMNFNKYRPWIILLEATLPNTKTQVHESWERILLENNYKFAYFDGLNRFYVAKEHVNLIKKINLPPNVFDDFVKFEQIHQSTNLLKHINKLQNHINNLDEAKEKSERKIAIISTPRSGNSWLSLLLSHIYDCERIAVHKLKKNHPCDKNQILQIHWNNTKRFTEFIKKNNFKVITIARHPLDILISILHFSQFEPQTSKWLGGKIEIKSLKNCTPQSKKFISWAKSNNFTKLLDITKNWWLDNNCTVKIKYEDLVEKNFNILNHIVNNLGLRFLKVIESAQEIYPFKGMKSNNNHVWRGSAGNWTNFFDPEIAKEIYSAQKQFFEIYEYNIDDAYLSKKQTLDNWNKYKL